MGDRIISEVGMHSGRDHATRPGITRRKLLEAVPAAAATTAATVVAGVGLLGIKGIFDNLARIGAMEESNNSTRFRPAYISEDRVEVLKGFTLYSQPVVPIENPGQYAINPGEIIKVGGLDVRNLDKFYLRKGLIVIAQDPIGPGEQGGWMRVRAEREIGGSIIQTYGYINLGYYSSRFVRREIEKGLVPIVQTKEGFFKTSDGKTTYNLQEVSIASPK